MKLRIGRRFACVEDGKRLARAGAVRHEQASAEPVDVVVAVIDFAKSHAGGYVQQGAQRRLAIFGLRQFRDVLGRRRIERADLSVGDGGSEE